MSASTLNINQLHNDVSSAQQGDQKAFARLVDATRNTVTSIALSIVKDVDSSEDVAQQVYIDIWRGINNLKTNLSFMPWLRQITRYKAYNYLRDNKVQQKVSLDADQQLTREFLQTDSSTEDDHLLEQQSAIIQSLIEQLPEDSREITLLYYREEKSTKQVAKLLEVSDDLVRKKLSRARQSIKQQWLDRYGDVLLSTAPTLGFTAMIVGAATGSSPAAATAITTSAIGTKASLASKYLALLSGAMLGAIIGAIAVVWSSNIAMKQLDEAEARQRFKDYRNQTIAWVLLFGVLLTLAYALNDGWIMPVMTYSIFSIGLYKLIRRSVIHLDTHIYGNKTLTEAQQRKRRIDKICGFWGTLGGCLTGFIGLIVGLIGSGRLG